MRMIAAVALVAALAAPAAADSKFHTMPGKGKLQLRVVKYDGEVNGELTVEVRNKSESDVKFSARGLYFVPDGDPDQAPQRLGAVGPMHVDGSDEDSVSIPAGGKVKVKLDVFCVDDERDAPTSETPFTVAKHRMPAALARQIDETAGKAARDHAEPDEVQSAVWESRDAKYKALDGEGAQEKDRGKSRQVEHEKDIDRLPPIDRDDAPLEP